ncbi:MAG TPA: hypothetical protein VFG39_04955 [Balneolaceae bacterium]|nr:hypothetical protein [Balneolaceae bacterium]
MKTKLLMAVSAILMGLTGVILSFFPQKVANALGLGGLNAIFFQILGALYFGFAMLNWTAKANLMGGIYSRPVAIGNFTHFLIGGLALIKFAFEDINLALFGVGAAIYLTFAILFGYVLFTGPVFAESGSLKVDDLNER